VGISPKSPVRELALGHKDHLLGQILYSLNEDCQWHRDWTRELVQVLTADNPSNKDAIRGTRSEAGSRSGARELCWRSMPSRASLNQSPSVRESLFTISRIRSTISGPNSLRGWLLKQADPCLDSKAIFSTDSRLFFMDTKDTKIPGNLVPCVDQGEGRDRMDSR
jgi:hypothetical protein